MLRARSTGSITLLVLVFGAVFFVSLTALSSFVLVQNRAEDQARSQTEAVSIAEAGVEYYRWFLSHFPSDFQNGTGHAGPYPITITNPEGGTAGTATLSINANTACGQTTSIDIRSVGASADAPSVSQTVEARYLRPSVALYSYIVNDSVEAGADRIINGPYHSNGGVRMDGSANAPVTSSLSTWNCTTNYGCSPSQPAAPGVVGNGSDQSLWSYPTPQVDFSAISADFSSLKSTAQANGIYLSRYSSGANAHRGYHLIFNANGTVTVKKVSSPVALLVTPVNNADPNTDYALIGGELNNVNTYTLPSDCGLIFVEDNTWIEGVIPQKVTVVVANVTTPGVTPDAFLRGNITYTSTDGSDGFTLISSHDILITPDSPQNMTLNGVFVAQSGAFGRNLYKILNLLGIYVCNPLYEPRSSLSILGSTISNKRTGTQWVGGCLVSNAGYLNRTDSFDRTLANDPPPFTPFTSSDFELVDWRQH